MEVTIQVPEDIAHHLQEKWGQDIPRHVLESVALECFRQRILGESQLRRLLGFETRFEVHAFLKQHEVPLYTLEDLEHDRKTLDRLGL
jgi:Uncharacterised protein family (UPF0175)